MDDMDKKDRRKGMKRLKEKKSSRSSGNLRSLGTPAAVGKGRPKTPKGSHTRSNSGSLSSRSGVVNFAVPPLALDVPTRKVSTTGKGKFRTHKGNAGFKSRCTDQERWHQYLVDESNFREPTFACPFAFVGREPKEAPPAGAKADDKAKEADKAKEPDKPAEAEQGVEAESGKAADKEREAATGSQEGKAAQQVAEGEETTAPAPEQGEGAAAASLALDLTGSAGAQASAAEGGKAQAPSEGFVTPPKSPVGAGASPKQSPKKSKRDFPRRQGSALKELGLDEPRTLSMLSDAVTVVNNVVQYQTLEQFGVKKFNLPDMMEWEAAWIEKIERYIMEKEKGKSLKNKVREKSLGVISTTPRTKTRSRTSSDAEKKPPAPAAASQKGGVSTKEISYGGLRTSINPLMLLDGSERPRSMTHKSRPRSKRSSTLVEKSFTDYSDSPSASETEQEDVAAPSSPEPGLSFDSPASSPEADSVVKRDTTPKGDAVPKRELSHSKEKKEHRSFMNLLSGSKSPRKSSSEDPDPAFALPRRSSSAKATPSAKASPSTKLIPPVTSAQSEKLESLLGLNVQELPQHFIPAGSALHTSADVVRDDEDPSVAKSISPLRLFSPRKKGKKAGLASSTGASEAEQAASALTPKGESGKKKRPGYFQSLKMQLKTPRGAKSKEEEDAAAHPRKRKSRTRPKKKDKDKNSVVIQRVEPGGGLPVPAGVDGSQASTPNSPTVESEPESPTGSSPENKRPHSASFDLGDDDDCLGDHGTVAALVDSHGRRSNRLSLPISRGSARGASSKSDTEAGLLRSPGGVRFEIEELNPPTDEED
mmetsp:Transcript_15336/g.59948  ORF Transcript_15336/g.59948 Transcript_15336/m.59948 type:complete len:820 (+) Transcript_15336:188-2647(+)